MIGGCICHGVQVNPLDHGSTLKLAWTGVFCGAACSFLNMLFYPEHASSKWSTNTSTKTRDKLPFDMFHVFRVNDTALQMQHVLWVLQSLLELSRVDISQVKLIIRILRSGLINIIAGVSLNGAEAIYSFPVNLGEWTSITYFSSKNVSRRVPRFRFSNTDHTKRFRAPKGMRSTSEWSIWCWWHWCWRWKLWLCPTREPTRICLIICFSRKCHIV